MSLFPTATVKQVGIIQHRIVDVSDLIVIRDQVSDLFSAKESVVILNFPPY